MLWLPTFYEWRNWAFWAYVIRLGHTAFSDRVWNINLRSLAPKFSVLTPTLYILLLPHSVVYVGKSLTILSIFTKSLLLLFYALSSLISNILLWNSDLWKFGKCGFLLIVLRLHQQHRVARLGLNGCAFFPKEKTNKEQHPLDFLFFDK